MKEGLAAINEVAGVRGSFIWGNRDEVIVSAMPADLDMVTVNKIGREVKLVMETLKTTGEVMSELDFMYERGRLVIRDLANAVLVVLCEPHVESAMLRLTLNVVIARMKGSREIQSQ